MSTNITTTYGTRKDGSGIIVAKGAGKQKTVSYDPALSVARNHGAAAGTLLRDLVRPDRRHFVQATAKHVDLGNGKHRFTVSL